MTETPNQRKIMWLVGQRADLAGRSDQWEFGGVFDTEIAAIAACRDWSYFVASFYLNETFPHETTNVWLSSSYPLFSEAPENIRETS